MTSDPTLRLRAIQEQLHPTDPTRCSEPIDIDDARWLLAELARLTQERQAVCVAMGITAPDTWTQKAIVALAEAHQSDSECMDSLDEADPRVALRTALTERDEAQRERDDWRKHLGDGPPSYHAAGIELLKGDLEAWTQRALEAEATRRSLQAVLGALVAKLDAMTEPLNGMCVIGHVHGMPYTGPTWGVELTTAKELLAATLSATEET